MKRLVEFALDHGGSVLVEVDEPLGGPATRGLGRDRSALVEEADRTFEDATAAVTPAARSLIARLRSIEDAPDEVGIEFGAVECADWGCALVPPHAIDAAFRARVSTCAGWVLNLHVRTFGHATALRGRAASCGSSRRHGTGVIEY